MISSKKYPSVYVCIGAVIVCIVLSITNEDFTTVLPVVTAEPTTCPKEPMESDELCTRSMMNGRCWYPDKRDSTDCAWLCRCDGTKFHCSYRQQPGKPIKQEHSPNNDTTTCSDIPVETPERQCNHLEL